MNAALRTEGYTITHSALPNRSCGMSSGTLRISRITVPQLSRRSVSLVVSSAPTIGRAHRAKVIHPAIHRFIKNLLLLNVCTNVGTEQHPGFPQRAALGG